MSQADGLTGYCRACAPGGIRWLRHRLGLWAILLGLSWVSGCGGGVQEPEVTPTHMVQSTPTLPPLPALDPQAVTVGRQVYQKHCASCHGPNAEGAPGWEEPDARGNMPPPPHDDSGHTWRHGDEELDRLIRNGWRDPFNKTLELTMPPFKDKLSDAEIRAIITYFKSLWSEEHRQWQWERTLQDLGESP